MRFSNFSQYLSQLEGTASRNQMTEVLAELFSRAEPKELSEICYLSLSRLAPLYEVLEFNLADKMMVRVLAKAYGNSEENVKALAKKLGDLGDAAEELKVKSSKLKVKNLGVQEVYKELKKIALESGTGSQEKKIEGMAELLRSVDPISAKYITRIPLGKLRLGFSDMTILDALSWMAKGDKSLRGDLERAYNVSSDIGKIAEVFKGKGIRGLGAVGVTVGTPIRPAAAERLPTAEEILAKLEGKAAVEPKIDGFRVQVHLDKGRSNKQEAASNKGDQWVLVGFEGIEEGPFVRLFSRNLENTTLMFPEVAAAAQGLPVKSIICEGEAIAFDPKTGRFLPFQEVAQRKRKYGIAEKAKELPLKVFVFDLLYLDGKDLLSEAYEKRRKALEGVFSKFEDETLKLIEEKIVSTPKDLTAYLSAQFEKGLEGAMVKKLSGVYEAGARGFNWIKYKREGGEEVTKALAGSKLTDTIDAVIMGYNLGTGKRTAFGIGGFLVGVLDKKTQTFKTIARIGTGPTDEEWREIKKRVDSVAVKAKGGHKPAPPREYEVNKAHFQDVWATPKYVVEVFADEITRSPIHSSGYALRFPRLVSFRDDKSPEDATTFEEIKRMFKQQ